MNNYFRAINCSRLKNRVLPEYTFVSGITGFLFLVVIAALPNGVLAQQGNLEGTVSDANTGDPLAGVSITAESTGSSVLSDKNGYYNISQLPKGDHMLTASFPGYAFREEYVSVNEVELLKLNMVGYSLSDNESNYSDVNYSSVITSAQMDRLGAYTVGNAIARVPGVQAGPHGEINLRGVGRDKYNVLINGQRMATMGMGDRSYDLQALSSDMVYQLEYIKVITPDMDADAMAGSVNLITRRPIGPERSIEAGFGGGADLRYYNHSGLGNRAYLRYSEALREDFSLSVNLNHQIDSYGWESLNVNYGVFEQNGTSYDVIESVTPGLNTNRRNRLNGSVDATFQPSDRTAFDFSAMMQNNSGELLRHQTSWNAGGDWLEPNITGAQGGQGSYIYNAGIQDSRTRISTLQATGRHNLDAVEIVYRAGWSQSRIEQDDFLFPFQRAGYNMTVNMEDRMRPVMEISNGNPRAAEMTFGNLNRIMDDHLDNTITGRLDVTFPFSLGSFKVGSSARITNKEGDYNNSSLRLIGLTNVSRFDHTRARNYDVLGDYHIPWLIDAEGARGFVETYHPNLIKNNDISRQRSDIWIYDSSENIYAGYGMAEIQMGNLVFIGGARFEHTDATYEGRHVLYNFLGRYEQTSPATQSRDYLHLLPNAQIIYSSGDRSTARLAYSRTIARPAFNLIAPFELMHVQDSTLFRGNPDLDAMTSDNLDLLIDHQLGTGLFSVGVYYKGLNNLISQRQQVVTEGDFAGFTERIFVAGDETASIYGVELSLQQSLSFLPGMLSNLGTYANYSYSYSVYDTDSRQDDVALMYHSPHVVNAALDYTQNRLFMQVSWHWTAAMLNGLQETTTLAPSIHPSQGVYMDQYQDGWSDLSATLRYRLSDNFSLWANASNLLRDESIRYAHTRDLYPVETNLRRGSQFLIGILFTL